MRKNFVKRTSALAALDTAAIKCCFDYMILRGVLLMTIQMGNSPDYPNVCENDLQ